MADPRETPAMQQYFRFKRQHPGCILLFRMGDFYEMFDEDAVTVSKALGLTLTQRTAGVPMAGMPFHQLEVYLRRLIQQGFRVAVCDQIQDARQAKGLVARAVTRVITPGTLVDEALVSDEAPATLAAILFTGDGEDSPASLAIAEVSTGSFILADCGPGAIVDELARRSVRELLFAQPADGKTPGRVKRILDALALSATPRPAWAFRHAEARDVLLKHFGVATLAGYGLREDDPAIGAAGALVHYLLETQTAGPEETAQREPGMKVRTATLAHLAAPRREDPSGFCQIDAPALRALEIERTVRGQGIDGSLLGLFLATGSGGCRTAMGKRLIREWLVRPLADLELIRARQQAVGVFVEDRRAAVHVAAQLDLVNDVARIAGRVALGRATPRDLIALARSIATIPTLLAVIDSTPALAPQRARLDSVRDHLCPIAEEVTGRCVEEAPAHLREGGLFRDGIDAELDEARLLQRDAGSWLAMYQERLAREHELPGLKVGYNRVFGYYIELSAAQARAFDGRADGGRGTGLLRKQTLKNAERFTTAELREFESKVMTAEARAIEREQMLFQHLCDRITARLAEIAVLAQSLSELDALLAFAERAIRRGWRCPEVVDEPVLTIHAGRHPVLEDLLGSGFVPNDVELGPAGGLALITGPNMAGKSTFIRQTALNVLLAHAGSYIPADRATIGLTDRIFTRVGADDALHAGQSTFMVEMTETASILHHATARSLVVLDEIGRGTSTLDGLSLAWAITEHLAGGTGRARRGSPRTLFATHYHELTDLEDRYPARILNLHVEVREWPPGDPHAQIIFLHRILPGRTDQSYGIHVAKLAGLPAGVIERAREVLASLAVHHAGAPDPIQAAASPAAPDAQMSLFTEYLAHPAIDRLREIKIDELSPIQAFDALRALKSIVENPRADAARPAGR
ncbi:MAG: DNA mismatch repair protein MutS [Phycisphaerales bacterium]|nr:DNA mismatch repair protein MutS [Phycisphaerales bacterium]